MKICKLKLKNLNSFREQVEVDFENPPLDDASLVAITGPTGAGKTTLLDAICVALYGKTPRLTGQGSQNPKHLISHGEKEGFAEVHFIANNTRYIATWSVKQGGSPKGQLLYAEDGKLISDKLSSRGKSLGMSQNTVSEEVMAILGLDFDAFKRSVMLAQGEFAAFLKASKEDRRTILEATAGIHIYDLLRQTLNDKINEVEAANADVLDKLNKIPEASHEQLTEAETEFDNLQVEAEALGGQSQQIQQEKDRETKRKEDSEKLQSSEKRQVELLNLQPEVDALQVELEHAQRAKDLRSEKREYDTAKSEREEAEEALDTATTGKTDAEKQVKADKADFDEKEEVYQAASTEHTEKTAIYNAAKLDVRRALDQLEEAANRTPKLTDLDNQIKILSDGLASKKTEQTDLQKQINEAHTFLDENPLPLDRQQRLTRATGFLAQLDSQTDQLETASMNKAQHEKKVSSLRCDIEELSKAHEKGLAEKAEAEVTLKEASAELNELLATSTREEWTSRKQQAAKAQPIVQKYDTTIDDLADSENRLRELNTAKAAVDTELEQLKTELDRRTEVCQLAVEVVQRCEGELKSVMWANPINEFRQHLHTGEPCLVCGATEHPFADIMEPEGEELIQAAESALKNAKTEAQAAQEQLQALQTKHIQTEQNERNTVDQIETCAAEIETLRAEAAKLLTEWQEFYPDTDISAEWIAEQIAEADIAIADIVEADQAHTQAQHACQMATQRLENCESNIKSENQSLDEAEAQLRNVSSDVETLRVDIASTENRFWELLPRIFHGVVPKEAVQQFSEKIEKVETHKDKLDTTQTDLKLLDAKIEADQNSLENLRQDRDNLQAEIDEYRREGAAFLNVVRAKTGGLETEDAINAAIDELEKRLQLKNTERDEATQQLQESQTLLTQKQTTHVHCENQYKEASEKLKTARDAYFQKLSEAGFDSPEAHDNAFRDDSQLQELTDQIDAYEDEKQQLEIEIATLRTRFEETPFDPEALGRIEVQAAEIGEQLQAAQQEVGAQQQRIDNLKDALEKREALGSEIAAAEVELTRWKRLREIIPANDLRDFALEIMFRQMGNLANDQLKYLTSERYQLKVEGIGDLTVIDRWNANEERPVETLSGGESFLTSLALALALADLSRGRAQLNSLFLDEGFGTLDTETLDVAIAALEGLRMQGRSIFLISHIQELTRRLPVKINVRKRGNGSSSIDIRG